VKVVKNMSNPAVFYCGRPVFSFGTRRTKSYWFRDEFHEAEADNRLVGQEVPLFNGTRSFVTMFTGSRNWSCPEKRKLIDVP
jgi:hypothetical protein